MHSTILISLSLYVLGSLSHSMDTRYGHRMMKYRRAEFTLSNGLEAQKLNRDFESLTADSACTAGQEACIDGKFAQCGSNNAWVLTACPATLSCEVLPLVNKAGTSITCDTEDDALRRIAATGATGGKFGDDDDNLPDCEDEDDGASTTSIETRAAIATSVSSTISSSSASPQVTSSASIASSTKSTSSVSSKAASTSKANVTSKATSKATVKTTSTKVITKTTSKASSKATSTSTSTKATSTSKPSKNNGGSGKGKNSLRKALQKAFSKLLAKVRKSNALKAQKRNSSFLRLNANDACKTGANACLNGALAECIKGVWVTSTCPATTTCRSLPFEFRIGTYLSCETDKDALTKILFAGGSSSLLA